MKDLLLALIRNREVMSGVASLLSNLGKGGYVLAEVQKRKADGVQPEDVESTEAHELVVRFVAKAKAAREDVAR